MGVSKAIPYLSKVKYQMKQKRIITLDNLGNLNNIDKNRVLLVLIHPNFSINSGKENINKSMENSKKEEKGGNLRGAHEQKFGGQRKENTFAQQNYPQIRSQSTWKHEEKGKKKMGEHQFGQQRGGEHKFKGKQHQFKGHELSRGIVQSGQHEGKGFEHKVGSGENRGSHVAAHEGFHIHTHKVTVNGAEHKQGDQKPAVNSAAGH